MVDPVGRLINLGNVRSGHNALKKLVDKTCEGMVNSEEQTLFIAYAGDFKAAREVETKLKEKNKVIVNSCNGESKDEMKKLKDLF